MKYLIVGLGNPGSEYVDTRHNVGFMAINRLAERFDLVPESDRYGFTTTVKHRGKKLHLLMPTTFMNLSGKAVRFHAQKHKIPLERVLIVTDDLALPFGKCRLKAKGSDGGHNGLKDIQLILNTNQYPRMRVGVGSEFSKGKQVDYVLSPFSDEEFDALPKILDYCVEGILSFAVAGIDRTMSSFNRG